MSPVHTKKVPSKPVLTRRSTKGPLEDEDPLATSLTSSQLSRPSSIASTSEPLNDPLVDVNDGEPKPTKPLPGIKRTDKDLSFLLEATIYHPLGQVDVPPAFRKPFPPPPTSTTSVEDAFSSLEELLARCHFLGAAHLSALILTSDIIDPTDYETIFRLLAIRYSSLELSGNVLLAAQEAKALEDLSSAFYYQDPDLPDKTATQSQQPKPLSKHCMPFDLRLQAIRLQSIGFSDARRGVSALYDLGLECREHLSSPLTSTNDVTLWEERLEEIGIRVVNALIETGDMDCAKRTLDSMQFEDNGRSRLLLARKILLSLKVGDISNAYRLSQHESLSEPEKSILGALLDIAAGRYPEAEKTLAALVEQKVDQDIQNIAKQNLAVALLYSGNLARCRSILEELVESASSFQSLTMNLATVYELSSDRARDLKLDLINRVAENEKTTQHRAYVNADFKL